MNEPSGAAGNFKNVFGILEVEHVDKSVVEGLRGGVCCLVDGREFVPKGTDLIYLVTLWLILHVTITKI